MFINPKYAIQEGWISGIKNEDIQVQPNALDFSIDKLFSISTNEFIISTNPETQKELKQMRGGSEINSIVDRRTNVQFFHLAERTSYDMLSDVYVNIPEGVAALLFGRSTFIRNGIFLTAGIFDSGYAGHIGNVIHNMSGPAKIEKGTRIGQIAFISSETAKMYAGHYNHKLGTNAPHVN